MVTPKNGKKKIEAGQSELNYGEPNELGGEYKSHKITLDKLSHCDS